MEARAQEALRRLQERIGHRFADPSLLAQALTHASARGEGRPANERLEFLGDAVLGLVCAHFLHWAFPDFDEGQLTRLRSAVVSTEALARLGRSLGLEALVHTGGGLRRKPLPDSVLANVTEALIGAVYLDGGLEAVRPMVLWGVADALDEELAGGGGTNWKSRLQELTQSAWKRTPSYSLVAAEGPDHAKTFVVAALLDGIEYGRGRGTSKKRAEQAAARKAFAALRARSCASAVSEAPRDG